MKVLHIELGRHVYGGARQVAYLLDRIPDLGGQHTLVCSADAAIGGAVQSKAVRIERLGFRGDADIVFYWRLKRLIRELQPDIVHVHSRRGDFLSIRAACSEGRLCIHSRRVDNPPGWFDLRLKFPQCDAIITISDGIRAVLLKAGVPNAQLRCVLSAVDTTRFRPDIGDPDFRKRFQLPSDALVAAVVAQLIPRKGHQVLFDALPSVVQRHPRLRVLLFGKGPHEAELRQRVQAAGLQEIVRFVGFHTDMHRILPCVDVVVHPALMEGLGVSLLEAAASGVPIIASRAGGMPEIVQSGLNGFLVEPGHITGVGVALIQLLDDPALRKAQGQAARQWVIERFGIPTMVEGNHRVYRELLEARSRASHGGS